MDWDFQNLNFKKKNYFHIVNSVFLLKNYQKLPIFSVVKIIKDFLIFNYMYNLVQIKFETYMECLGCYVFRGIIYINFIFIKTS